MLTTPIKQPAPSKDKEKADTKRLARCGKCANCKSQVSTNAPPERKMRSGPDALCSLSFYIRPACAANSAAV